MEPLGWICCLPRMTPRVPSELRTKDRGRMLGRLSPRVQVYLLSLPCPPIIFRLRETIPAKWCLGFKSRGWAGLPIHSLLTHTVRNSGFHSDICIHVYKVYWLYSLPHQPLFYFFGGSLCLIQVAYRRSYLWEHGHWPVASSTTKENVFPIPSTH